MIDSFTISKTFHPSNFLIHSYLIPSINVTISDILNIINHPSLSPISTAIRFSNPSGNYPSLERAGDCYDTCLELHNKNIMKYDPKTDISFFMRCGDPK